jgi:hypothetical protein
MGYIQLRVCDCCKEEITPEDTYKITKVIMETDRFTDAAGSRDYNQINLELCTNCAERLVQSLEKIIEKDTDLKGE